MRRFLVIALILALPAPLAAQSNAERMANDWYTRSHDYDLVHQRIQLRDINWDSTSFKGRVTSTLVALRPGLDSVILDAGHLLSIQSVVTPAGRPLNFSTSGDTLVVHLARPAAFHDTVRFSIAYDARIQNGRGLTFIDADTGANWRPQQIWSQGEDDNNHDWFPTYDFPNDKMSWEMIVTLPTRFSVVSNGKLVSDRPAEKGQHTVTWSETEPSATYLVSLIVAPLVKVHDTWQGKPVDYYVYARDSTLAWRLFHVTPDMIQTYSDLTGIKYPWAKYAQTTVADFFGGMENVSATTLVDWLPDATAYLDRPWYQYILIPHELAHQWFGDYVTTENWANMWLNEGFAEFMPGQYWAKKLGRHAEEDYYLDEYNSFMRIDQRRRMPLASLGSNNIYPKGALVLEMLEHYLGPQAFWASVNRYLKDHAFDNATSDDLRQAVLDATGQNLDWWWQQWVYDAGYPEFTVGAQYDSAGHALVLDVKQTQVDTSSADSTGLRYGTPQAFRMPVTVRVGTAGGEVTRTFQLAHREDTLRVEQVQSPPTMVIFDDNNQILKKLTFDQPSAWLAQQLSHDPDLWNRWWVIGQLAARDSDTVAVNALADAATGADYYLTRVQAIGALADLAGERAMPTLTQALRDTSATVRGAAVEAMGQIPGGHAVALLKRVLAGDSSYAVRAAAIGALAVADSANRREYIQQGLSTPSYRGALQNAALGVIARSGDTSYVEPVAHLLGDVQNAAFVLASFANRGNARALDVLVKNLDSPRSTVRNSVLQAFRFVVQPKVGLPALQAAVDSLSPRVKEQVQGVLKQMEQRQAGNGR